MKTGIMNPWPIIRWGLILAVFAYGAWWSWKTIDGKDMEISRLQQQVGEQEKKVVKLRAAQEETARIKADIDRIQSGVAEVIGERIKIRDAAKAILADLDARQKITKQLEEMTADLRRKSGSAGVSGLPSGMIRAGKDGDQQTIELRK